MKNIMIIEDDEIICNELTNILENSGYKVSVLTNFKDSLEEIKKVSPDLILLDINIPYINGELLLQNLRKTSTIPVIMVTSRNSESDEVLSMSYGADDYITKPYNPTILLLRINAIFKRINGHIDNLTYKNLNIDIGKGTVINGNNEVLLTKNEMLIFSYLVNHHNQMVTRDELMTLLWNNSEFINDNALTVNISRLRTKLKELGYDKAIETRKGYGYILL